MVRYLGLGRETTYGTAVAPTKFLDIYSDTIRDDQDIQIPETIRGRDQFYAWFGRFIARGNLRAMAQPEAGLGEILKSWFGQVTSAQIGVSGVYTHTFDPLHVTGPSSTKYPSLSIEKGYDEVSIGTVLSKRKRYSGCKITTLQFEVRPAETLLRYEAGVIAQNVELGARATPTFSVRRPFKPHDATVRLRGGTMVTTKLRRLLLNLDQGFTPDEDFGLGQRTTLEPEPTNRRVTGEISLKFIEDTEYKEFLGNIGADPVGPSLTGEPRIQSELELTFIGELTGSGVAGAENFRLRFTLENVVYKTHEANFDAKNLVIENLTFESLVDTGLSRPLQALLVNQEATIA